MVTERDHTQHLRQKLIERKHNMERELQEIDMMISAIAQAEEFVYGDSTRAPIERREPEEKATRYNMDFSKHVIDYVASYPLAERISVTNMVKDLVGKGLLHGKPKSLVAHASSIMKELAEKNVQGLTYEKGFGYSRARQPLPTDKNDSVLVHSS